MIYAATEATLEAYRKETVFEEIPVLKMLSQSSEELKMRTGRFAENLREKLGEKHGLHFEVIDGASVIGGGSAPMVQPPTAILALSHEKMSVSSLEQNLRLSRPPVIARIVDEKVLIDLRTVSESEERELLEILGKI